MVNQSKLYRMQSVSKIHFVGIGGVGMGGIANVLLTQGYQVSGSDQASNAMTASLKTLGAEIFVGHDASHVAGAQVVVISSVITEDNPEVMQARAQKIPVIPRAQMLAEIMRFRYGISVAGAHGKTTTTSILAQCFAEAQLDPTFVVGGLVNGVGAHARLGQGPYLIAEADESDGSFLRLNSMVSILTNIDNDHLSAFDNDFSKLKEAYVQFLQKLPFYGLAVVCLDCPHIRDILPRVTSRCLTYGFSEDADFCIKDYQAHDLRSTFTVHSAQLSTPLQVTLNLAGKHNALNAVAAIVVCLQEGIEPAVLLKALATFAGVGRRLQVLGDFAFQSGVPFRVMDDYGHHPCEIKATCTAIRENYPDRRLVVVYEPHRYSRFVQLFDDFVRVLNEVVDVLVLMEIYGAGEAPVQGADVRTLARSIRQLGRIDPILSLTRETVLADLPGILQPNDIVLTLGAGSVTQVAHEIARVAQEAECLPT